MALQTVEYETLFVADDQSGGAASVKEQMNARAQQGYKLCALARREPVVVNDEQGGGVLLIFERPTIARPGGE